MFHPDWVDGCPSSSAGTDELSPGFIEHLNTRDTTYAAASGPNRAWVLSAWQRSWCR
jgi:predicted dithiol-disulfide oxidoreductase (DUF899 family)